MEATKLGVDEMYCSSCGSIIKQRAEICVKCGVRVSTPPLPGTLSATLTNTSGQGPRAVIPAEISGWNWGAFFLNWIWGVGNSTYFALLALVPYVGVVMIFVLGAKGSTWAWRNHRWDSVEHFKRVQRKWAWWGLGVFCIEVIFVLILTIYSPIRLMHLISSV